MGLSNCFPMQRKVKVKQDLVGQLGWPQLFYSRVEWEEDSLVATPLYDLGRLEAMGASNGLVMLPEDCKGIKSGEQAIAWIFTLDDVL
jgi:molybdopterin biosynthesis enzyme